MKELQLRRALAAGVGLSIVLTGVAVSTADDGTRISALAFTLAACLFAVGMVVLVGRELQRRSMR